MTSTNSAVKKTRITASERRPCHRRDLKETYLERLHCDGGGGGSYAAPAPLAARQCGVELLYEDAEGEDGELFALLVGDAVPGEASVKLGGMSDETFGPMIPLGAGFSEARMAKGSEWSAV